MTATATVKPARRNTSHASRAAAKMAQSKTPKPEPAERTVPTPAAAADRAATKRRVAAGLQSAPKPADAETNASVLAGVTAPGTTPKPAPKPKPAAKGAAAAEAAKAAARAKLPQPKITDQPKSKTPKPPKPTVDKTAIVHSAMIRALADLAEKWDESTGVTKADATKLIAHRAAYCSPKAEWDKRFPPRHIHAAR